LAATSLRFDYTKPVSHFRWDEGLRRLVLVEGSPSIPDSDRDRARLRTLERLLGLRYPKGELLRSPALATAALN
jgi:hypothetical protein